MLGLRRRRPQATKSAPFSESPSSERPRIFLAYAREDLDVVVEIDARLRADAETWLDVRQIPPNADWWDETQTAIAAADRLVFFLSSWAVAPDAVALRELSLAHEFGKRTICVRLSPISRDLIPPSLIAPNWITADDGRSPDTVAAEILRAARVDLDWARLHAQLTTRARDWSHRSFGSSLLGPREIETVDDQLSAGVPPGGPNITEDVTNFIRRSKAVRRRRRRLASLTALLLVAILGTFLGVARVQRDHAQHARRIAQSRALAAASVAQIGRDEDLALLLAMRAWATSPDPSAAAAVRAAAANFHESRSYSVSTVREGISSAVPGGVNAISTMALSTDARQLAYGAADGSVRVARRPDLAKAYVLPSLLPDRVSSVAFSHGDRYLAAGDTTGALAVWRWPRPPGRLPLRTFRGHSRIAAVAFNPLDDRELAVARADGTIEIRTWMGKKRVVLSARQGHVTSLSYFEGGGNFATGGSDGTVKVWTLFPRPSVLTTIRVPGGGVTAVRFLGGEIMTGGRDGVVRVYDWQRGEQEARLHADGAISAIDLDEKLRLIAAASSNYGNVWYTDLGPQEHLVGHQGRVTSLVLVPGTGEVITGGNDGVLRTWHAARRPDRVRLFPVGQGSYAVTFDPKGQRLALAGQDGRARVWDLRRHGNSPTVLSEGRLAARGAATFGGELGAIAWDPRRDRVVGGDRRGWIYFWNLRQAHAQPVTLRPAHWEVQGLSFTPDGRHLAASAGDRVVIIAAGSHPRVERSSKPVKNMTVVCMALSRDGRLVAVGDQSGRVHVWAWKSGTRMTTFGTRDHGIINSIAFSNDSKYVVTGTLTGVLRVWNAQTGDSVTAQRTGRAQWGSRFASDGQTVLSLSEGGSLFVWPWATGQRPTLVPRYMRPQVPKPIIDDAQFSTDLEQVAAGINGSVFVRRCLVCGNVDRIVRRLEGRVHRKLSPLEQRQYGVSSP